MTVYSLYRETYEIGNNPNFSQAVMLYECIRYKDAYPDEDVTITLASFHLSVALSACLDPESPDYGSLRNVYDADYTDDGYYRLVYLLAEAARKGIEVTVISPRDANPVAKNPNEWQYDLSFVDYFNAHLSDDAYIPGKKVSDYMTFRYCAWKCYGDKAAADMMHNKVTTVSNFLDNNGVVHGPAVWTGSINIDGVDYLGRNGNDSIQTAVIVEGHEELRRVSYNYTRLLAQYCGQEDIVPFRALVTERVTEQIQLLLSGRGDEIPSDEQIVYIGSETDPVFELYFTPLGGDFSTWDEVNNPYITYLEKLMDAAGGTERIEFLWNNVKYIQSFELADMIMEAVSYAFEINQNPDSILRLHLPGVDASYFSDLDTAGLSVNETGDIYHIKDFQLSYIEDGVRYYVSVLNSLNFHEGAMYHQTNTILIIKESEATGNDFYIDYATLTSPDVDLLSRRIP